MQKSNIDKITVVLSECFSISPNTPALRSFAALFMNKKMMQGEVLIKEGERGKALFILASGQVAILKNINDQELAELARLGPLNIVGELSLLDDSPRTATVCCIEDGEIFYIQKEDFRQGLLNYPEIALGILISLSQRFRKADANIVDALKDKYDALESKKKVLEEFITRASHELITPLTSILMASDFLQMSGLLNDQGVKFARIIRDSSNRLAETVDLLIQAAKGTDRLFQKMKIKISPAELVCGVYKEMIPLISERALSVDFTISPEKITIFVCKRHIEEAVTQIFLNAVRFTHDHGTIHIGVYVQDEMACLSVADSGVGIRAEDIDKIYDPFFSTQDVMNHSSGKVEFGSAGLGLGLYVSKQYVENEGGRIEVDSVIGEGSCFRILLPLHRE
jgi:signal transduction histidine kinase